MHKNPVISVLLYVAIFLPFIGLGIIFLDDFEYIFLPEELEMLIMLGSIGISLIISSLLLISVNKTKKDGEHVSSAPYAGKVGNLTKGQALFWNLTLLTIGVGSLMTGIYIYLFPVH